MTHPEQQPPDERNPFGKFMDGCLIVAITALVAVFLVFGLCVIALRNP